MGGVPNLDMTDNLGFGKEGRRNGNLKILNGELTFRYVRGIG